MAFRKIIIVIHIHVPVWLSAQNAIIPVGLKFSWKNKNETRQDNTPSNLVNSVETADKIGVTYSLTALPQKNNELPYLPAEVQKAFAQAEKNMHMEGCEEPAVIMYRRAMEAAIGLQYPQITKGNLKEKIDTLESQHIIPAAMKDWAHEIRLIGNDGAHELSGVTRADAEAAQAFTTAFLQYCISLPEEIKQRRALSKPAKAAEEQVDAGGKVG